MTFLRWTMLLMLGFFGFVVVETLGKTPAFNPQLVANTIIGDGRIFLSRMMYDQGEYEFQRGYGFLNADAVIAAETGLPGETASKGANRYRAFEARDALLSAVRIDPGNAHAWAALAWAYVRLDDLPESVNALRISWEIAPHNATLAKTRVNLVGLLTFPGLDRALWNEDDLHAFFRDIDVLEEHAPRSLQLYQELYAHLFQSKSLQVRN